MESTKITPLTREMAALACASAINTDFFRAFCEPVRVSIFSTLVRLGRSDIGTISLNMPQDRSVIARHLQLMANAGLVRAEAQGRHTFYEIDGASLLSHVDRLSQLIRQLVPVCCSK